MTIDTPKIMKTSTQDERGAVTIDWVALTAAVLLMGSALVYVVFDGGVAPLVDRINETLVEVGEPRTCPKDSGTSLEDRTTLLECE